MTRGQRAAVKKMQAGLRRWRKRHNPRRARARRNPGRRRHARRRNAPPGELAVTVGAYSRHAGKRKRNPSRRRRRRSNPKRSRPMRRRRNARRAPVILINPRGRKHHRSRRNPGGMSLGRAAKQVLGALIPAAIAGGGMGFLDAVFLGDMAIPLRMGAKLLGAGLAGALLRSKPSAAYAAMGAILGTTVYEAGVRAGGGVIATSKPQGMKQLAGMAGEDRASMGLLQRELAGMGLLLDARGMHGMGAPVNTGARHAEPDLGGGRGSTDDALAAAMSRDWSSPG